MKRALALAFPLAAALGVAGEACSASNASSAAAHDAAADVVVDAARDAGSGFPVTDASDDAAVDAGSACDQLRAQVNAYGLVARACNPQGASACTAAADGICCQISVSIGSTQAVDDFQHAVSDYATKCGPTDCTKVICDIVPTGICDGTGTQGICR
jgi:hypothetical protein